MLISLYLGFILFAAMGAALLCARNIWLVRYDPRTIEVSIQAGENGGETLPHANIVRELTRLGLWDGGAHQYPIPPSVSAGLRTAILVQEPNGGQIIAALKL